MDFGEVKVALRFQQFIPILVGVILGIIFEKLIRTRKFYSLKFLAVISISARGWVFICSVIIGAYFTLKNLGLVSPVLDKALFVILGIFLTFVLAKMVAGFVDLYTEKIGLPSTTILTNLVGVAVAIIGILVILNSLGISVAPVLAGLGVGGLAVALALQNTLADFFAGLQLIASKQIRLGDFIRLENGEQGYVVDITWRNTVILELPNNLIIVPNTKLSKMIVKNFDMPQKEVAVVVPVGVSYDSDLDKVERVTIEVAKGVMKELPEGIPDFEPFIRYNSFGEYSINFSVFLRAKGFREQYPVIHEFIKRLHKKYKEEGIIIPFPIRTVYLQPTQSKDYSNTDKKTS